MINIRFRLGRMPRIIQINDMNDNNIHRFSVFFESLTTKNRGKFSDEAEYGELLSEMRDVS